MEQKKAGNEEIQYEEILSSGRTEFLFAALMLTFALLMNRRAAARGMDLLTGIFLLLTLVFLFYALNYRKLEIQITPQALKLKFGLFHWSEPLANIESAAVDELPWLLRNGGAGIHFMLVGGSYRASYNFLEHARVVLRLKEKRGLVQDLSFSTRDPQALLRALGGGQ